VANGALQGWHADPFGLHQERYFSVGNPTKLVRDGRVEAYDEPPAAELASAAAPAAAASGSPASGSPALATATLESVPPVATGGTSAQGAGPDPFPRKNRRRRVEYAAVAVAAVGAILAFVALEGGSGSPDVAPAAFVTKAAQRTLSQSAADFSLSGTANLGGQQVAIGGSGQIDFASDAMSLNLGASMVGGSVTETELLVGGNLYMQVSSNGRSLAALTGGRHWLKIPLPQSGSKTVTNGSPASSLAVLSQQGARVTPLGQQSIGGQTCSGYIVTPSRQAMLAGAREELAREGMSQAQTNAALQGLQGVTPPTITVYFDTQRQLACQVSVYMQVGTPTSDGSGDVQVVMTFTHYGVPVKITPPAAADTFTLQQLLTGSHH
jgi:hypothetical protein